jgi:pilus assembly protein CpaF
MTPDWLGSILTSPEITDICLTGAREAFVDRGNGLEPAASRPSWSDEEMRSWVLAQISAAGKTWDAKHPFIDASLSSGHRLHVAFPPLSRQGILVSIRRLPQPTEVNRARERWGASPAFETLLEGTVRGDSILISGSTGCGKTTLARDLLEFVPHSERVIALEDTPELAPHHPHFLSLISRPPNADGFGEVTLRALLRQALRMRPDRIVLGECRGPEVLDLLQVLNTGHKGAIATLHANSPRDALRRTELLCLLSAGSALPVAAIRELLATGVQWVAQLKRVGPKRMITELWKVEGREGDTILMRQVR